jgi:P-type conjugative transfer ATPase TrbB
MTVGGSLSDLRAERARRIEQKLLTEMGVELLEALHDPDVVEILVNADGRLWLERLRSGLERTETVLGVARIETLIGTVAAHLPAVVNRNVPILECELPLEGARFEGVLPPVSRGPLFAIRKHARRVLDLGEWVASGALVARHHDAICEAIELCRNIVVAGGASSGKTTFANALLEEKRRVLGESERIVVLEDTPELRVAGDNVVQLRTTDSVDLARLVRATLRLRPDAIVVGEVRGREALDLLKAWNTGHRGGIGTVHANDAGAALPRLDQLLQEAGVPSQPHVVAEAVDLVVGMRRVGESRRVDQVVEVEGFDVTAGVYELRHIERETRG